MMDNPENNTKQCSECKSTFIRQSDMLRHIKRFHKNIADKLIAAIENQDRRFKCKQCNKRFFHKKNLNFHEKSHDTNNSGVKICKKCPFCEHVSFFKKDFYTHCQDVHKIALNFEKIEFVNIEDFEKWKTELEANSHCKYLKEYGSTPKISHYVCNQSKVSDEDTDVKTTDGIDGFCPAGMKVTHEVSGKCSILYLKTHICHQNKNFEPLKKPEKEEKHQIKAISEIKDELKSSESVKSKNHHEHQVKDVTQSDATMKEKLPKNSANTNKRNFLSRKKEMIHNVLTTLNTINNMTELEAVQELINPIQPIINILRIKSVRSPKLKTEVRKK